MDQITMKKIHQMFSNEKMFAGNGTDLYDDIYSQVYDDTVVHHYGNWILLLPKEDMTDNEIKMYYRRLWNNYYTSNKHNIDVLLSAYMAEYNPLDNYNRESTITVIKEGTESHSITGGGSNNYGEDTSTVNNFASPEENEDFYNTEKSVAKRDTKSDTYTQNNTDVLSFDNRKDTTTEIAHGSIGTLAPIDMIKKELDARFYDLLFDFITHFVRREFI